MKTIKLVLLLSFITNLLFSQKFEMPENYKLETAGDYKLYEQDVIRGINWLLETPVNEQPAKRKEVNTFLLKWISGSPHVHIMIKSSVVTFIETSPDLLMVFMCGWTKYSIESKQFDDNVGGSLAGIEAVVAFYTKNAELQVKDKNVEKYIKLKSKGKLKEYLEKNA